MSITNFIPKMEEEKKNNKIKTKKFDTYDELIEYIEDNKEEVNHYTFNRLKDYWLKNKKRDIVDIYSIKIIDAPNIKNTSIFESEWEHALFEIETYFVDEEMYEHASQVRDLSWNIFGKIELDGK